MTTLPLTAILRWILNKLQEIDTQQIFAFPVSLKEVSYLYKNFAI